MRLLLALLLSLLACAPGVFAQEALRYDTSAVEARTVPEATLQRFADDPAFQYERGGAPRPGFFERLWNWLYAAVIEPALRHVPAALVNLILYLAVAAAIIFAIVKLFTSQKQGGFSRGSPRRLDDALQEGGIEQVDLRAWLYEALAGRRYREAVRIHFLIALQDLAAVGLIEWAPEKTNRQYATELEGTPVRDPFVSFAALFERAWYGDAPTGEREVEAASRGVAEVQEHLDTLLVPS